MIKSDMMKRLWLFLALFFFSLPLTVHADEGWVIDQFRSDIIIQKSGVVKVAETIDVDFNSLSKHGIYRDIPYAYLAGGEEAYTEIDIESVLQNENKAKYEISRNDGYVRIKIGDPDQTISGRNKYVITYDVKGALRGYSEHDELYWNVTGNNWPVVINKALVKVRLPSGGIVKKTCYEGYKGSIAECMIISESSTEVNFATNSLLDELQGLTVVVGYNKNQIPILTVNKPKSYWEKFIDWPSLTTLLAIILSGVGSIVYLWNKSGRDYWLGQNIFGKKDTLGSVKPIGAHEATVVEYTPPEKLRPAEVGVLMDERADTHDVVATIIDLASRGYMTITEVPKKWLFGKTDYLLQKKSKNATDLLRYERMLLDELFKSGNETKVSDLKKTFYDELKKIKEELYREVVAKKLFPADPEKVRSKYVAGAFILGFLGLFLIGYTISLGIIFLTDLCLGMLVVALVLFAFSRHMPRRTAYGRELYRRIKGYRLFIDKAEKHRQKFFEKKNLFNEVLPYTIVFGITQNFAKQMEEIGFQPANTTWYSSTHHFNTNTFAASMTDFSSSMSSAMATTPSSSGGFSSGGSSGGGFGGGGGGSW